MITDCTLVLKVPFEKAAPLCIYDVPAPLPALHRLKSIDHQPHLLTFLYRL